jgi:electron transfer flavoprotein alpha subunit
VANVLVTIELAGDRPSDASLECLGEGRRIASFLGATLYAVLPCTAPPSYDDDDLIAELGRHGADKVILVTGPDLGGPPMWAAFGPALVAACDRAPPALVLVPATAGGRDFAPRLAAHLGAAYVPEPSVEYGPRGELVLSRTVYGGAFRRRLHADDIERPVVVTLTPGSYAKATGTQDAEMIVLTVGPVETRVQELSRGPDAGEKLDGARVVVTAGAGVKKEQLALVEELARALGGELALTHAAVEAGLGAPEREVGIGGRQVAPRLYVAVGASGSPAHLAAVSPDAAIVAINSDADAPIFRVAAYGVVGDVGQVVPKLIGALKQAATEKAS